MAEPGDWPWHVALFKEEIHVCDATLVAENWLITTASCFQGYILLFLDYFQYKNIYAAFLCITQSQTAKGRMVSENGYCTTLEYIAMATRA